jgi:integrase
VREAKPWYRKSNDSWYVEIAGRQVRLAKGKANRAEAVKQFHILMAGTKPAAPKSLSVSEVCDLFLRHSEREHTPETFAWHKRYLQSFCDRCGHLRAVDLIPFHLTTWLDANPGWKGGRRHAAGITKRALAWAREQGLVTSDPFADVSVPRGGRRERVLTEDERKEILAAIKDQPFRDFVFAMQETGCRPGEIARVTKAEVDLDLGVWVLQRHKTAKKSGKPRVVYLTPAMVELTRKLVLKNSEGPLFRGPRGGRPFSRNNIRCRFRRLREKFPQLAGVVAYSYRHTYCTAALVNGVGVAQVAELMGHTSTDMVTAVYSKLSQQIGHLREAARRATGA